MPNFGSSHRSSWLGDAWRCQRECARRYDLYRRWLGRHDSVAGEVAVDGEPGGGGVVVVHAVDRPRASRAKEYLVDAVPAVRRDELDATATCRTSRAATPEPSRVAWLDV